MSTFGERLKQARINSGISQADAAKQMGLSRPSLSAIEADKRQVLASEILQFASLYGTSAMALMGLDDVQNDIVKKQVNRLLKYQSAFQKLDESKKKKVMNYINQLESED